MQAGVQAPSADNRHCFRFEARPDGIALVAGDGYVNAPLHRSVLNRISIGAVIENMLIRAARLGYEAELHWPSGSSVPSLLAEIRLNLAAPRGNELDMAIASRHTNRSVAFSGPELSERELTEFAQLIRDIPGVRLAFCDSGRQRDALLRLVMCAETERFRVRALHRDLFSAVRFDVGWHASASEGLPPGALGVEAGMRWAFAQLRRWPLMKMLCAAGLHHVLGFRAAYLPCRLAPHRAVITTSLPMLEGAISVGRAMQRLWLLAERRGLAFQPLAGGALLALPGYDAVTTTTGERLRRDWASLTGETPLMIFRMGYAKPPQIRAGRPPLESYLGN
jgi:hypothetical protein